MGRFKKIKVMMLHKWQAFASYLLSVPLSFMKGILSRKNLLSIVRELHNPAQPDEVKALSAAFGVFMGIIPVWGLQTILAIFVAFVFKLNKSLVIIFSQVSIPPLMPFIVYISYRMGAFWMVKENTRSAIGTLTMHNLGPHLAQYICGSVIFAVIAAVLTWLITFASLKLARIIQRYRETQPVNLKTNVV